MKLVWPVVLNFVMALSLTRVYAAPDSAPSVSPAGVPAVEATSPVPALSHPQGKISATGGLIDIANEPIVRVVQTVQPAVVNITAEGTAQSYTMVDPFFNMYRGTRKSQSIGSGLIISADGYVLTNAHVVSMADQEKPVSVTISTGSKFQAQIVTVDEDADLALLKISDHSQQFPFFDLDYTSPNLLGETVIALGSPEGYQNSVSSGILSARDRTFTAEGHTYKSLIQTDAAINPGNSGGPLVDLNGSLAGINAAKLAGAAIENIGFAIPNSVVVPWVRDALAGARGEKSINPGTPLTALGALREHFGLSLKTLAVEDAQDLDLDLNGGMVITQVAPGSPAAAAGLDRNMIVVAIGRWPVTNERSLPQELVNLRPGNRLKFHIIMGQQIGPLTFQRGGSVILTAN